MFSCLLEFLQKSWKRRFFVLSKTNENHYELTFFKDENKREKPLGQINLYRYVHNHIINTTLIINRNCLQLCLPVLLRCWFCYNITTWWLHDWQDFCDLSFNVLSSNKFDFSYFNIFQYVSVNKRKIII